MSRTFGHTMHRYAGHKEWLAASAERKARELVDVGAEPTDRPFWDDAFCECASATCENPHCRDEAHWFTYEAERTERAVHRREAARWAPEPRRVLTGHLIAVEWEDIDGGRFWETIDSGTLDYAIWRSMRGGYLLSDVDELAEAA